MCSLRNEMCQILTEVFVYLVVVKKGLKMTSETRFHSGIIGVIHFQIISSWHAGKLIHTDLNRIIAKFLAHSYSYVL